jgi:hypothetical protein
MLALICHQVPSMLSVMHHLGIFYIWRQFNVPDIAHVICHR